MLLTMSDLNKWVTSEEVDPTDAWGKICVEAASERVRTAARQPSWTIATAPARARQIAAHLAARSFLNPESITTDGALGPLGGDRRAEDLSKALHLTAAEEEELRALGDAIGGKGGLWVQPVGIDNALSPTDVYLYSAGSDWGIPYLHSSDLPALG